MDISRVEIKEIKEAGIVKAIITNCAFDAIYKINDNCVRTATSAISIDVYNDYNNRYYLMPYQYSAVARCMPGDEYDFEKGKDIAIQKLTEKYHAAINKRIARFVKHMTKAIESANQYLAQHTI